MIVLIFINFGIIKKNLLHLMSENYKVRNRLTNELNINFAASNFIEVPESN